eukprot:12145743-Alexandrium_andersonii.AAC.1
MLSSLAAIRPGGGSLAPTGFHLDWETYGEGQAVEAPELRALRGETLARGHLPEDWCRRFRQTGA